MLVFVCASGAVLHEWCACTRSLGVLVKLLKADTQAAQTSTMKTACATTAALALVASASAFVAPAASARGTHTEICFCINMHVPSHTCACWSVLQALQLPANRIKSRCKAVADVAALVVLTGCVTMNAAPEGRRAFASKAAVALIGKFGEVPTMRCCNPQKLHNKLHK
jgi:hypothetical protein